MVLKKQKKKEEGRKKKKKCNGNTADSWHKKKAWGCISLQCASAVLKPSGQPTRYSDWQFTPFALRIFIIYSISLWKYCRAKGKEEGVICTQDVTYPIKKWPKWELCSWYLRNPSLDTHTYIYTYIHTYITYKQFLKYKVTNSQHKNENPLVISKKAPTWCGVLQTVQSI